MRISIITPSYNQGRYIEQNILSVLRQNHENFEHIIIDGGSTDNTLEILRKYPHLKWISERDEGQADALNKGFKLATGDIIGWINSDDYYENDIFHEVIREFENGSVRWTVGNLTTRFDEIGKEVKRRSPEITKARLISNPDILRQQATFFRKEFLDSYGLLNKLFYLVMDYDLWIRLAEISEPKMVDRYWAYFRMHPAQKTSIKNLLRQVREINFILKRERVNALKRIFVLSRKIPVLLKYIVKIILVYVKIIDPKYLSLPYSTRKL